MPSIRHVCLSAHPVCRVPRRTLVCGDRVLAGIANQTPFKVTIVTLKRPTMALPLATSWPGAQQMDVITLLEGYCAARDTAVDMSGALSGMAQTLR